MDPPHLHEPVSVPIPTSIGTGRPETKRNILPALFSFSEGWLQKAHLPRWSYVGFTDSEPPWKTYNRAITFTGRNAQMHREKTMEFEFDESVVVPSNN